MRGILGALKGISRGVILLVLVAVFPAIAWIAASYAESAWGMGFVSVFIGVLALEVFLAGCAVFGMAPELEKSVGEAIEQGSQQGDRP